MKIGTMMKTATVGKTAMPFLTQFEIYDIVKKGVGHAIRHGFEPPFDQFEYDNMADFLMEYVPEEGYGFDIYSDRYWNVIDSLILQIEESVESNRLPMMVADRRNKMGRKKNISLKSAFVKKALMGDDDLVYEIVKQAQSLIDDGICDSKEEAWDETFAWLTQIAEQAEHDFKSNYFASRRKQAGAWGAGSDKMEELREALGDTTVLNEVEAWLPESELEEIAKDIASNWEITLTASKKSAGFHTDKNNREVQMGDILVNEASGQEFEVCGWDGSQVYTEYDGDEKAFASWYAVNLDWAVKQASVKKASVKQAMSDDEFGECASNALEALKNFIEDEGNDYMAVDSEVFDQIHFYCDELGIKISDEEEDELHQIVIEELEHMGLI